MGDTLIYLVRHGEVDNPHNLLYGRLPRYRLSSTGRAQAEQTAKFLSKRHISAVYSSPLLRARQTAAPIAGYYPGYRVRICQLLNEVHTSYEGRPGAELDARNGDIYYGSDYEQPEDIMVRLQRFFAKMLKAFPHKRIAAVTHGDVITFGMLWATDQALIPENKTRLHRLGFARPYPAHASVIAFYFSSPNVAEKPRVTYEQP